MTLTIGIDIGGTKIAAGVVDAAGRLMHRATRQTPADGAGLYAAIDSLVSDLTARAEVVGIGLGVAGFIDRAGTVRFAPHLPWQDEPVRERLAEAYGLPVVVDNDANVGGWAESRFGAAAGVDDALFVAVGTGIGGAVISAGTLVRGGFGMAGEIGHIPVVTDGRQCPCGLRGCWEQYASGRALMRRAADAGFSATHGTEITAAAIAGTPEAVDVFTEVGHWLGVGMAVAVTVLDPAIVVVGGGVSAAGDLLLDPARQSLADALPGGRSRPVPKVVLAALGPDAAIIGAADLARG